MSDLHEIIASNTVRAYNQGARDERERILFVINEQIEKQEENACTFEETAVLIGLKKAQLYVKEMKWT